MDGELNMLISVIIPCFNMGEYVTDAVKSVLNQPFKDIEIIVVDDHSTDNSLEIYKKHPFYFGIRYRIKGKAKEVVSLLYKITMVEKIIEKKKFPQKLRKKV